MFYKYLIILMIIQLCHQIIEINGAAECRSAKQSCSQCIAISHECFWCEDKSFNDQKRSRCDTLNILKDCVKKSGENNENPIPEEKENKPFGNNSGHTIQLRPQKVNIRLRAGSKIKVPISYKRAIDYPMDLYYLMDLSCTMFEHKTVLGNIGERLARELENVTSNFRIGFGSFVDKPIMPFSSFEKISPICGSGEPPYSFSHKQSLTKNATAFVQKVKEAKISGYVDAPEGTLDALMQVLTCKDVIGWRTQSNKIIVVATDEEFHYAGDGKLAGIVTPNDGECHTNKDSGSYTFYNITDYPSMYQIAEKALGFNIVFSVSNKDQIKSNKVQEIYRILAKIIGGNARVAALKADDDEAVKFIHSIYNNISTSVELIVKSRNPEYIDIQFYSKCHKNKRERTSKCEYKEIKEIEFEVEIQLKSCPTHKTETQEILIGLPNNENEVLNISLTILCGCDCDKDHMVHNNSTRCNSNGTLACGICRECNGKRTGSLCECDPEYPIDPKKFCRKPNICSDRGKCECNKCDCTGTGYHGKFCEFDESGCYPNNDKRDKKCNSKGECVAGKCKCDHGYIGSVCECTTSKDKCIKDKMIDNKVCSDQGKCECGQCKCKETTTQGTYCQFCPSCDKNKYCNESRECVPQICETYYGSKENCTQKCNFQFRPIDSKKSVISSKNYKNQCIFQTLDNECSLEFTYIPIYNQSKDQIIVFVSNATKYCKEKINLVIVSGSVVAGTILVGLALLLIWKLLTEFWDRKEYARFQKELSQVNWEENENPLYKEVNSTFTNPMFVLRERATKRLSSFYERLSRRFNNNN